MTKGFAAGAGACTASVQVLRSIDLTVQVGESIALVGQSGCGKSTLLLCAAGLLRPDSGEVRWFGQSTRAEAVRRSVYYCSSPELARVGGLTEPTVHLVDVSIPCEDVRGVARWVERRRAQGDAVIVSTCDEEFAHHLAARVLVLRGGRVHADAWARSRVAEYAHP